MTDVNSSIFAWTRSPRRAATRAQSDQKSRKKFKRFLPICIETNASAVTGRGITVDPSFNRMTTERRWTPRIAQREMQGESPHEYVENHHRSGGYGMYSCGKRSCDARRSSLRTGRIHRRACRLGLRPIPLLGATRSAMVGSGSAAVGMAASLVVKSDAGWCAAF
jgi:hypothetical protein